MKKIYRECGDGIEMENIKSDEFNVTDDRREIIKQKLRQYYDGRIVRKDLTKSIREGANVPVYVLEYLLGQYCNSDNQEIIDEGVDNVKRILRDNYVRPDEAQKILSLLRERGSYTVIDRITVVLNTREDRYEATFSKLISICHKGDIVVSQDYGVAAMALGKGAYAIHQSGKWYTNENIDMMLMERYLNKKARRGSNKNHIKGPKKRTEEDDVRFAQSFEKLILMAKSKEGAQSGTI